MNLFILIFKIALTVATVFFAFFFKEEKPTKTGKVLAVCGMLLPWISVICRSARVGLLYCMALSLLLLGYCLYLHHEQGHAPALLWLLAGVAFLISVLTSQNYTFVDDNRAALRFLWIPLAVSVIMTAIVAVGIWRGYLYLKDDSTANRILIPICVLVMSFCTLFLYTSNLNYCFDDSPPRAYEVQVVDREADLSGETINYVLTVRIGGEDVELYVNHEVYKAHEKGSALTVALYDGAFGEAYYIHEGK